MKNENSAGLQNTIVLDDAEERVSAELAALKVGELLQINLEVMSAVSTVLGVLPKVRALREQMVKELPSFDIVDFDKLEDYAFALQSTHVDYVAATQPPDDLPQLSDEALKLRERLELDARALAINGLLDGAPLAQLKGGIGYKNMALDLGILTNVLHGAWGNIQGKTAVTAEALEKAVSLSKRLMRIVGVREQSPAVVAEVAEQRMRAFTRLIKTYEATRRAVSFLRGELDDADTIAPSLYQGRPRRRASEDTAAPVGSTNGTNPAGTSSGTTAPAPARTVAAQAVATESEVTAAADADADRNKKQPFLHG
jgi:hypothetical protein